jgi:HPt (histidine-containing phosphotransfer) domain-containing protein
MMDSSQSILHSPAPIVARDRLLSRCMGKRELVDRLIQMLAQGLPKDSNEIRAAMDAGDLDRIAILSHRMKGAAANMCADPLSSAAAALETAARERNTTNVPQSWFTLQQQIDLVLQELTR